MHTPAAKPSNDDLASFYATQQAIHGVAPTQPLDEATNPATDEARPRHGQLEDGPEVLADLADALDAPKHLVVGNLHITVTSPNLDGLINLLKALQAESTSIGHMAEKAEGMATDLDNNDMAGLLKTAPAARALFLDCIKVQGRQFKDQDKKWEWFTKELPLMASLDVLDMFTDSTDWATLMTKVRRIMGKLRGLAAQVNPRG